MQKPSNSHGNTKTLRGEKPGYVADKQEKTAKLRVVRFACPLIFRSILVAGAMEGAPEKRSMCRPFATDNVAVAQSDRAAVF